MRKIGTASMYLLDYRVEPTETLLYNNDNDNDNDNDKFKKSTLIYHKNDK